MQRQHNKSKLILERKKRGKVSHTEGEFATVSPALNRIVFLHLMQHIAKSSKDIKASEELFKQKENILVVLLRCGIYWSIFDINLRRKHFSGDIQIQRGCFLVIQ